LRVTAVLCGLALLALSGVQAQNWSTAIFDDFNIEDGTPSSWWTSVPQNATQQPPGGMPQVFQHRLCGTTQSVALFAKSGPMQPFTRLTYLFESATTAGFETYLVAMQATNVSSLVMIGCDGGFQGQGFCQPVMRPLTDSWTPIEGVPQALEPHHIYKVELVILAESNSVVWTLSNSFGESMYAFSGQVPGFDEMTQGGLLVGRSGVTCVDDFRLEVGASFSMND